jgi:general secretion pathway protein N
MRRRRGIIVLTLFFVAALVALLPMRLALDWFGFGARGLSARAATGSLWLGVLQEARAGPVPLGDVKARLNFWPLFLGRARLSLAGAEEGTFRGAVTVSRHSFGFDDVSARVRVGAMLAPLAISALDFDDVSGGFASGRCIRGEGRVRASMASDVAGLNLASGFSGEVRCAGEAVLLPLVSQTGLERLDIRLFPDGRYQIQLAVRPSDEAVRGRLLAAGFRPSAQGYGMRVDGAF